MTPQGSPTTTRSDLLFLRRRVRPEREHPRIEAVAAPPPTTSLPVTDPPLTSPSARPAHSSPQAAPSAVARSAPSAGLSLGPTPSATPSRRPRPPQPFDAPGVGDVREIDGRTPVVRVDRVRSAVGTLAIAGASSVAWESVAGVTGAATSEGETLGSIVPTEGNRPLVEFDDGLVLVALRHVRELRRALVIARRADALGLRLFDGETLTVPTGVPERLSILQILVVDGMLELRAEPVDPSLPDQNVHQEFGFSMTHRFVVPDGMG